MCGEWTCAPPSVSQAAFALGYNELNAKLVVLEHRYYGDSQLFTGEDAWKTENLKLLNTTQALADTAYFIEEQKKNASSDNQYVVIGGSYPGALSAWFKHAYPNHAVAAWSSSGVINAIQNFTDFDKDIFETTMQSGKECTEAITKSTALIENILKTGTFAERKRLFDTFGYPHYETELGDFMFFVADTFTMGVQYGQRTEMCDYLTSDEF